MRMCYACPEVEGTPEPALHIPRWPLIRANIQFDHRTVICLSKQETSEGARWALWKRGRNPTTRHANIDSQPASYIYSQSATMASLWSEGLLFEFEFVRIWDNSLMVTKNKIKFTIGQFVLKIMQETIKNETFIV